MKNLDSGQIFKLIGSSIRRFHITIFIIILVCGLAFAVLTLNGVIQQSSDTNGYTSNLDNTSFDQSTIDRLNQLQTSDSGTSSIVLPAGRINPFTE
jgi:hypothetical protein